MPTSYHDPLIDQRRFISTKFAACSARAAARASSLNAISGCQTIMSAGDGSRASARNEHCMEIKKHATAAAKAATAQSLNFGFVLALSRTAIVASENPAKSGATTPPSPRKVSAYPNRCGRSHALIVCGRVSVIRETQSTNADRRQSLLVRDHLHANEATATQGHLAVPLLRIHGATDLDRTQVPLSRSLLRLHGTANLLFGRKWLAAISVGVKRRHRNPIAPGCFSSVIMNQSRTAVKIRCRRLGRTESRSHARLPSPERPSAAVCLPTSRNLRGRNACW